SVVLIFVSIKDTVSPISKGFNQIVGVDRVCEKRFVKTNRNNTKNKGLRIMFYFLKLIPQM
ncbi:MAG: hypothetical protein WC679_12710, partial [Bacteroidales bacterium]